MTRRGSRDALRIPFVEPPGQTPPVGSVELLPGLFPDRTRIHPGAVPRHLRWVLRPFPITPLRMTQPEASYEGVSRACLHRHPCRSELALTTTVPVAAVRVLIDPYDADWNQ